jgi:hypothetical protein
MHKDDMILVSIDDHSIEPPDMYERHVPARWRDQAAKIIRGEEGPPKCCGPAARRPGRSGAGTSCCT